LVGAPAWGASPQSFLQERVFDDGIGCLGPIPPFDQVEKELSEICASILQLLDEHLIPTASSGESKVFYLKMKVCVELRARVGTCTGCHERFAAIMALK
jgi:hypothetical protein